MNYLSEVQYINNNNKVIKLKDLKIGVPKLQTKQINQVLKNLKQINKCFFYKAFFKISVQRKMVDIYISQARLNDTFILHLSSITCV